MCIIIFEYLRFHTTMRKLLFKNVPLWRVSAKSSGEKCCLGVGGRPKHREKKKKSVFKCIHINVDGDPGEFAGAKLCRTFALQKQDWTPI